MQESFDFDAPDTGADTTAATRPAPPFTLSLGAAFDAAAHGAVIATVNRRLSRHLSERYVRHRLDAGDDWWETPVILPLTNWLSELHDVALANGVSAHARIGSLQARKRWQVEVSRRHQDLLDVDAAARDAQRAWRLAHTWDIRPQADTWLAEDAHAFRTWASAYAERLDTDQLVDEATLTGHLVTLVEQGEIILPSTLILAGFLVLTPELERLRDALRSASCEVLTVSDEAQVTPRCQVWTDDAQELAGVASAVRRHHEDQPDAVLGVVLPDLDTRRGAVRRAFDKCFFPGETPLTIDRIGRPYDLSIGTALIDVPVVKTAMLALRLTWQRLDRHGLATLLHSPYLLGHAQEAAMRERLEGTLREWRVRYLSLQQFRSRLPDDSSLGPALGKLQARVRDDWQSDNVALGAWADRFGDVLAAFGWPGDSLSSEEYQAVQSLHGALDDLQALDDGDSASPRTALADLHRLVRERVFQPETPAVPIQLLGRLESHGQRFDALWITGLDSERWPAQGRPTPFLSIDDQRQARLPEASPEARLTLARREYEHWCASAPTVTTSHARLRDDKPLVAAAILTDIQPGLPTVDDSIRRVRERAVLESIDDARGPATDADVPVRGGARLLEDQAKCPFRAFALHRLEIRPLEEATLGPDARQRGTFLHRALELFWQDIRTQAALLALDPAALEEHVVAAVDTALAEDAFLDPAIAVLERVRMATLIQEWLQSVEMRRPPFEVESFEQKVEHAHGGITVNLTIDRVDRIGDARVVIDYKSGKTDTKSWSEPRIDSPQLPLYALARNDVDGVAFGRVRRGDCRFLGVAADDELLPNIKPGDQDWPAWRAHWRAALDTVAAEIAGGVASVTPTAGACDFCELESLCRVRPTRADEDGSVADGTADDAAGDIS